MSDEAEAVFDKWWDGNPRFSDKKPIADVVTGNDAREIWQAAWSSRPAPQVEDLVKALERIAGEENIYKGHGDFETVPACSAEEAQRIARAALAAYRKD